MIERERKYRLTPENATLLEARLDRIARSLGHEIQETIVFADRANALPKGTLLRYRTVNGRRELTVKGTKRYVGLDRMRSEWTIELGDGPIFELLAAIGFEPETRYRKDTRRYALAGVVVSIDRLDDIGLFCEIESHDLSSDLDAVATVLGLESTWFETRGYPSIAADAEAIDPRGSEGELRTENRRSTHSPTGVI